MDVIRALLLADARRRWRSWLALVVLAGVVAGIGMAAVAGWRRTSSAMDRFLAYHEPFNGYVEGAVERADVEAIDGVEIVQGGDYFLLVPIGPDGEAQPELLGKVSPFSYDQARTFHDAARPIVVAGRLPDPAEAAEVAIDEAMADLQGLQPGDELRMQGYAMSQAPDLFDGLGSLPPTGEVFEFTVTGVIRGPQDVIPAPDVPDVVYLGSAEVHLGPAFDRAHRGVDVPSLGALFGDVLDAGAGSYELRFDPARTSRSEVEAAIAELDPDAFTDFGAGDAVTAAADADRTISLQSGLLLAFGLLVLGGGSVLVALALRRQLEHDRQVQQWVRALGMDRATALGLAATKGALLALPSAALATGVALALSPLSPVGHASRAEIDRGVDGDATVLGIGAALLVLLVTAGVTLLASRSFAEPGARRLGRGARTGLSDRAARLGLAPSVVAGVRAATVGTGGATVAGSVLVASLGIVGALSFAASEERLANDRALWGWTFDAVVGDGNDPAVLDRADEHLAGDERIAAFAGVDDLDTISVASGDRRIDVNASVLGDLAGHIEPMLLEGTPARTESEISLAGATAAKLGVGPGDRVQVDIGEGPVELTVSGLVVMNLGFDAYRIGEGALLNPDSYARAGGEFEPAFLCVRYTEGVDPDAMYDALREDWGNTVLRPIRSVDIEHLHEVRHLPVWFSGLLAAVAVVSLAFVLGVTIRRRRRDLAVLRTLGFDAAQLRGTLFAHASVLVVPAAALGAMLGVAAGRVAWTVTARGLGAPQVTVTPLVAVVAVIIGAGVLGVAVALWPARLAGRMQPAGVLRTE